MRRRDFGSIRRLPSGRYQARYRDKSGIRHARTFPTRGDASRHLAAARVDLERGTWIDPTAGAITFEVFAEQWLQGRRVKGRPLAPRTRERYESLLRVHVLPSLGRLQLRHLRPNDIRRWYRNRNEAADCGPSTVAKTYRLVHAVMASAVVDEHVSRNPCSIPGGGVEIAAERPVATIQQVYQLAATVHPRYRALVLMATFSGLRFGELAALARADLDLRNAMVTVERDLDELDDGRVQYGRVKSEASRRVVAIPHVILPELAQHLAEWASGDGPVFRAPSGGPLRRSNFRKQWILATSQVGLESFRFHDLRHTGNTLAAATGASTRELMARLGQSSPRAALIYQHATRDRDHDIAAAVSHLVSGTAAVSRPAAVRLLREGA